MIALIAAMAKNRVIGQQGKLPWQLPQDLRRFKQLTMGHTLLMGRKTWQSLPGPLAGRRLLVLSRDPAFQAPGAQTFSSIDAALQQVGNSEHLFVCGGEEIYRQLLPRAEQIYLTIIDCQPEGDCFFPHFSEQDFRLVSREQYNTPITHSFTLWQRRKGGIPCAHSS